MLIKPFKLGNTVNKDNFEIDLKQNNSTKVQTFDNNINLFSLQQYLIDNYLQLLKNEDKESLFIEIKKYLYTFFKLQDEEKICKIADNIFNKMFGYDILHKYILNENISDIRVVKYNQIYIKEKGNWSKTNTKFKDEGELYSYIKYCVLKNNGNINYDTPIITLSDKKYNLRIEAGIAPVNVISPSLVIRIHRINNNNSLEKLLLRDNMFNYSIYTFLIEALKNEKNIVICGKGGSGKTTLLRALINKLPNEKSICINEETAELYIENKNVIEREIINGRKNNIDLDLLSRHSLVMSCDVVVIGELKGKEASSFFDGISTGHIGLATVHSDSSENALDRLVTLIKKDALNSSYKEEFIEKMLSSSLDYVIFMKNYKIHEIAKVVYNKKSKCADISLIFNLQEISDDLLGNYNYYEINEKELPISRKEDF